MIFFLLHYFFIVNILFFMMFPIKFFIFIYSKKNFFQLKLSVFGAEFINNFPWFFHSWEEKYFFSF